MRQETFREIEARTRLTPGQVIATVVGGTILMLLAYKVDEDENQRNTRVCSAMETSYNDPTDLVTTRDTRLALNKFDNLSDVDVFCSEMDISIDRIRAAQIIIAAIDNASENENLGRNNNLRMRETLVLDAAEEVK